MKISTKLYISFWLTVVFFILVSLFFIFQTYSLYNITFNLNNHPLVVSKTLQKANFKVVTIQASLRNIVHSTGNVATAVQDIIMAEKQIYKHFNTLEEYSSGAKQELFELIKLFDNWRPIWNEIKNLHKDGQTEQAIAIYTNKSIQQVIKLERAFKKLTDVMVAKTSIFLDNFYFKILKFLGISTFVLIAMFIGGWIVFAILLKITPNLNLAFSIVDGIVTGKLQEQLQNRIKCDIDQNSEQLLQALDTMQIQLYESMNEVNKTEAKMRELEKEKLFAEKALHTAFSSIVTNTKHF